jgi:high affinity Mn2+ porin
LVVGGKTLGTFAFVATFALASSAGAADVSPIPVWAKWTGFYFGGHTGYGLGHASAIASAPGAAQFDHRFSGVNGGVQAGYNHLTGAGVLLGIEADVTFPNYLDSNVTVASVATGTHTITERMDFTGSLRGRVGYAFDPLVLYVTGGFAFAGVRAISEPITGDPEDKHLGMRTGWVAGGGAEYAFDHHWTARLEYLYSRFNTFNTRFSSGTAYTSTMDFHAIRLGLNWRFNNPESSNRLAKAQLAPAPLDWELHAQTTYLHQGYPSFRAAYTGPNSFTPTPQAKNTWTASAYVGVRTWEGGEVYYNPELLQGFGLNNTVGAAGFPNGEAQKSNFPYPHYNTSRLFARQTFGFGGEQETLESAPNQLSGKVDVSRLTLQAGKFAVVDVFDGNAYAKDTRKDFMNWSIWAPGAFDYSADKVGLSYGVTAELNQRHWALRAGYFLMGDVSNSNNFDTRVGQRGGYVMEVETRYSLLSRPGKFRVIGWFNSAFSGSYRETLDNPLLNLDITQTRKGRIKYGYVFSVEQSVTDDIGLFSRWSWNDGRSEIMAFTDIDASLSLGASVKGTSWGRPSDTIGIAGAINALSRDHRDFIAAGGLGVLIGDGQLSYRRERVLEAYYSLGLWTGAALTADYQRIANPAYNADRGPVSIFSGRFHAEF